MRTQPARRDADDRLRRRLAAGAAFLLNLVFLIALDRMMGPLERERPPWRRAESRDVLQVRLIEQAPAPPPSSTAAAPMAEPPEPARPTEPRPRARTRTSPDRPLVTAPVEASPASPQTASTPAAPAAPSADSTAPAFYGRDGQVRLPEGKAEAAETPFPQLPIVPTEGNPFVHRNPVPYEPTRFDKFFPDVRETLAGEIVRKATVQRTARLPGGSQVTCTWVLFFGGCGWGPVPTAPIEVLKAMRVELPPLKPIPPEPTPPGG